MTITSTIIIYRYNTSQAPIEITTSQVPTLTTDIRGEIQSPCFYNLRLGYTISDAIEAVGGLTDYAATNAIATDVKIKNMVFIYVPAQNGAPQRININMSELWLLDAFLSIGETLAQRIIDYRTTNGPFMDIDEIKSVAGMVESTFAKIKDKIIV
ncbi:helix-hairpin-helix domain-containing protein [Chloroflexota bacterium]